MPSSRPPEVRPLRASLLSRPAAARVELAEATPSELLASSPPLQRVVESYDRSYRDLLERNACLRVGLVLLATTVAASLSKLAVTGTVDPIPAFRAIGFAAVCIVLAVGMVSVQWGRAYRRLRRAQTDRMLRAVAVQSDLPPARVAPLTHGDPEALDETFQRVHEAWVERNR